MTEPRYTVSNLADYAPEAMPPEAPREESSYEPSRVHLALNTPYDLGQWREDLERMADGVPTGFPVLDGLGMTWLPGKLTAVLARPGGGKTAFLLESACRFLERDPNAHALFLSWEEPLADVVTRLLMRACARRSLAGDAPSGPVIRADQWRQFARGGFVPERQRPVMEQAHADVAPLLARLHLMDGDDLGRNVRGVLAGVAEWMREEGAPAIGLVCVDYFQKLRSPERTTHRLSELQDVADTLRRFAKGATLYGEVGDKADTIHQQYAVPVIVGAQVNRAASGTSAEIAGGKGHPTGDQIREGDDLLNDASNVLALSWEEAGEVIPGDPARWLRLTVPKHRGGRTRGALADEVARMQWNPARAWMADDCQRDDEGRIAWRPIAKADETKTRGTKAGVIE